MNLPLAIHSSLFHDGGSFDQGDSIMPNNKNRSWFIVGAISSLLLLSACAPGRPIEEESFDFVDKGVMPDNFSFLAMGRALSGGAVDLYDPYAKNFTNMPRPPRKPDFILGDFPKHTNYQPFDPDVAMFALTHPGDDLEIQDPEPLPVPVPLNQD
jgi:hypothetical protein